MTLVIVQFPLLRAEILVEDVGGCLHEDGLHVHDGLAPPAQVHQVLHEEAHLPLTNLTKSSSSAD